MTIERSAFYKSELRALIGPHLRIIGHAAVFNQLSDDLGGFREKIQPGAFADTIKDGDIRALWNHDANFVLARTKSGTLKLSEDQVGLAIDAELPDTNFARDLLRSIERNDVDQMSFGFRVLPKGDSWRMEDGGLVRTLTKVELFDVSPVTFPAYPQTDVQARSLLSQTKLKELEDSAIAELAPKIINLDEIRAKNAAMRERMTRKLWT
jgi:Escherichia/Staphylococcus phage prohead protease